MALPCIALPIACSCRSGMQHKQKDMCELLSQDDAGNCMHGGQVKLVVAGSKYLHKSKCQQSTHWETVVWALLASAKQPAR